MSRYETVLTPDVTSTDITLDDAVDGYGHNFTLQYILTSCSDITPPVTTATFAFGKKGQFTSVKYGHKISTDKKHFQIQFGPIDYCLNWGVSHNKSYNCDNCILSLLPSRFTRITAFYVLKIS